VVEFPNGVHGGRRKGCRDGRPCSIENREQIFETAARVKAAGASFLRGGAFKPRSSRTRFREWEFRLADDARGGRGQRAADGDEVMEISQIEAMLPYTDLFQVGARNMQNFNLLRELGRCASYSAEARDCCDD